MKKTVSRLLALVLMLSLLTGCGASSTSGSYDVVMKNEMAMSAPMAPATMDAAPMAEETGLQGDAGAASAIPENRKWIITMDLTAETENLDAMLADLDVRILALNGYVEAQNIYNGSSYSSRRYRSASLTVRIPAESADRFVEDVSGISNVVRSNKNLEDITLTYTATESRVKALQTEEGRLLELMAKAETMSDLLEIEARLTEVRYQLENATTRLKGYDNKVDYATVYLNIEEVQEYTPVEEVTLWQRISSGFISSLKGVGEGIVDFFVWIIVASPYLAFFGALAAVCIAIGKRVIKRRPIRRKKKSPPAAETE